MMQDSPEPIGRLDQLRTKIPVTVLFSRGTEASCYA